MFRLPYLFLCIFISFSRLEGGQPSEIRTARNDTVMPVFNPHREAKALDFYTYTMPSNKNRHEKALDIMRKGKVLYEGLSVKEVTDVILSDASLTWRSRPNDIYILSQKSGRFEPLVFQGCRVSDIVALAPNDCYFVSQESSGLFYSNDIYGTDSDGEFVHYKNRLPTNRLPRTFSNNRWLALTTYGAFGQCMKFMWNTESESLDNYAFPVNRKIISFSKGMQCMLLLDENVLVSRSLINGEEKRLGEYIKTFISKNPLFLLKSPAGEFVIVNCGGVPVEGMQGFYSYSDVVFGAETLLLLRFSTSERLYISALYWDYVEGLSIKLPHFGLPTRVITANGECVNIDPFSLALPVESGRQ